MRKGEIYILTAGMLWGFIGLAVRPLTALGLSAIELTFVRSAAVFVTAAIISKGKISVKIKDIPLFLASGVGSIVFFNVCYFLTQQTLTLSLAGLFLCTSPCFVMLISAVVFREKITAVKLFSLVAAMAGCVLAGGVLTQSTSVKVTPQSLLIGLCSGLGYALYGIFGKTAVKRMDSLTFMLWTFFTAALALLPFVNIRHIAECAKNSGAVWLTLFSLLFTMLPYLFYTKGLENTEAGKAAVLSFAEPLTATVVGAVFFGESLTAGNVLGIVIILFSVYMIGTKE